MVSSPLVIWRKQPTRGRGGDYYVKRDYKSEVKMNPELDMFFPANIAAAPIATTTNSGCALTQFPENLKKLNAVDAVTGEKSS